MINAGRKVSEVQTDGHNTRCSKNFQVRKGKELSIGLDKNEKTIEKHTFVRVGTRAKT